MTFPASQAGAWGTVTRLECKSSWVQGHSRSGPRNRSRIKEGSWENQIWFPGARDTKVEKPGSEWRRRSLEVFLQDLGCSCRLLLINWRGKRLETGRQVIDEKYQSENRNSEEGKTEPGQKWVRNQFHVVLEKLLHRHCNGKVRGARGV